MTKTKTIEATRWSGADWASEKENILLVGVGGIGSWTALNLSRIGHSLYIFDPDTVDATNVSGGQMYKREDIGTHKVYAVRDICRELGSSSAIEGMDYEYDEESEALPITITGLDNMKARKNVFNVWKSQLTNEEIEKKHCLLIDGRLLMEQMEIFAIRGDDEKAIQEYEQKFLFDDSEAAELECTAKQTTFAAMIISGLITATLCNFLTNKKMGVDFREVPFHQKLFLPLFMHSTKQEATEEIRIEGVKEIQKS